jgi:hypothetical protein
VSKTAARAATSEDTGKNMAKVTVQQRYKAVSFIATYCLRYISNCELHADTETLHVVNMWNSSFEEIVMAVAEWFQSTFQQRDCWNEGRFIATFNWQTSRLQNLRMMTKRQTTLHIFSNGGLFSTAFNWIGKLILNLYIGLFVLLKSQDGLYKQQLTCLFYYALSFFGFY